MNTEEQNMDYELEWVYARYGNGDAVADIARQLEKSESYVYASMKQLPEKYEDVKKIREEKHDIRIRRIRGLADSITLEYLEDNGWKKFIAKGEPKTWISDADTGDWLDIKEAYYRYGDRTPMGYGYGAVKENKEGFFNYITTIQRIKDGKTDREAFIKKHKMRKHGLEKDVEGGMKCASGKCGGK